MRAFYRDKVSTYTHTYTSVNVSPAALNVNGILFNVYTMYSTGLRSDKLKHVLVANYTLLYYATILTYLLYSTIFHCGDTKAVLKT